MQYIYIYIYLHTNTHVLFTLCCIGRRSARKGSHQRCTSKGIRRQGIALKRRNSLQTSLCPVICPYLELCLCKRAYALSYALLGTMSLQKGLRPVTQL